MPRNISFAMTTEQIKNRTKTVTRRYGWGFLKPGDILNGVEKAMGLKKGEKIKRLCQIRVISIRWEPLERITQDDVIKEGFPDWTPVQFIQMLVEHYGAEPSKLINRIEFEYVEGEI
ncbi:ASCH domain-containing protein [Paremcibacter congregatus]|uniref:ASCH domain-containing protein n=1 Tax=Paremcibacter congregatus TaxID=2043170 RepID=UPI0030EB4092|tara:strand:+ start:927 stop:1277 length:351 start_codon:yes stop_codon:yes gene_type:complete